MERLPGDLPPDGQPSPPLGGLRVIEFCNTIAGPTCTRLLADFGAEVIKVEPPEGDPVRQMGFHKDGLSLYTPSLLRGKRVVVLDLKQTRGAEVAMALIEGADIVVENYRPGVMERFGLGYEAMSRRNPGLVMVRISGYGQDGPYSDRPGYGVICEAVGGVRNMIGEPDRPPARVALPSTDHLGALYGAFGALVALRERARSGRGQVVDVALYEAAFTQLEMIVSAHELLGVVPAREGARLGGVAPNNLYPTRGGGFVLLAANNQAIWRRLVAAMQMPGLADDPRFASMQQRARPENAQALDRLIADWTAGYDADALEAVLRCAEVPAAKIYTIADIFEDPHFRARDMLVEVAHPRWGHTTQVGIVPKLSRTPGRIGCSGPELGHDTAAVLGEIQGSGQR
ncbi:MAG: CoA transferase [Burkholderiaceae bacterium]|nr:CoA transferase [Burkholderiaceae bacterium]